MVCRPVEVSRRRAVPVGRVYGGGPSIGVGVAVVVPLDGPAYTHEGTVEHEDETFAGDQVYVSMTMISAHDGRVLWHQRQSLDLDAQDPRDVDAMVRTFVDGIPLRGGLPEPARRQSPARGRASLQRVALDRPRVSAAETAGLAMVAYAASARLQSAMLPPCNNRTRVAVKQPPGLFLLFGVEMWERFSFYGMRAMLSSSCPTLTRGGFGWTKPAADRLYGLYGFCAYALPLGGGYLADRLIGTRRSMVIGGLIIAAGHFCLALPATATFFLGLALVVIGTGFFKPNVRRWSASSTAKTTRGATAASPSSTWASTSAPSSARSSAATSPRARAGAGTMGFGAAGVGMVLGVAMYLAFRQRYLPGIGLPPARVPGQRDDDGDGDAARAAHARRARLSARAARDHGVFDPVLDGLRADRLLDELLRRRAHAPTGALATHFPRPGSSR